MKAYYFIFLIFIVSCSSAYIPSPKNVPLFENRGEVQLEVGTSTNSLYLTGNYAFSEKYAMITNGSISYPAIAGHSLSHINGLMTYFDGDTPHYAFEAGIGRYNLLLTSTRRLEIFAGAGYGSSNYNFTKYPHQRYFQGFVQANIGKRYQYADIGWSLRTAYSDFLEIFIEHINYQVFHIEPLFVVRVGGQYMKWFFRCGINLAFPLSSNSNIHLPSLSRSHLFSDTGYTIFHFSTGMSFRFSNAHRNTKQKAQSTILECGFITK